MIIIESTSMDLSIVSTDNSATSTEEAVNRAVFYVWQGHPLEASKKWLGTAFAIGSHQCLTAKHLIKGKDKDNLYLSGYGLKTPQKISACKPHESRDVCLLTIDKGAPAFADKLTLSTTPLEAYQHSLQVLHAYGYVKEKEALRFSETKVSTYNGEVSAWALAGFVGESHSGGCLLNNQQEVVGVIYCSNKNKNDYYAVAVDSFRDWLNDLITISPSQEANLTNTALVDTILSAFEHHRALKKEDKNAIHGLSISPLHRYLLKRLASGADNKKLTTQFIQLSVFTDEGKDNEHGRFQVDQQSRKKPYQNLANLLNDHKHTALVLIGRPGNGKTTLLRHLELQLAYATLLNCYPNRTAKPPENCQRLGVPFYVELNQFPPKDTPTITPLAWLEQQWQQNVTSEQTLTDALREQPVLLLLDALNEMAIPNRELETKIREWQAFLVHLQNNFPLTRALFSCRTIDYSTVLSDERNLPVPQIHFKEITPNIMTNNKRIKEVKISGVWSFLANMFTGLSLFYLISQSIIESNLSIIFELTLKEYNEWVSKILLPVELLLIKIFSVFSFKITLPDSWRHYYLITTVFLIGFLKLLSNYDGAKFYIHLPTVFFLALISSVGASIIEISYHIDLLIYYLGFFILASVFAKEEGLNVLGPNIPRRQMYIVLLSGYFFAFIFFAANAGAKLIGQ